MEDCLNIYKNFSISIHKKLKSILNASIICKYNQVQDTLYIDICRLGIDYSTKIEDFSNVMMNCNEDRAVQDVVKSYRSFINHKFFY